MKVLQINATSGIGSTGKICRNIAELSRDAGIENIIACRIGDKQNGDFIYGVKSYFLMQALFEKITGKLGLCSKLSTLRLIKYIEKINPDIVHLHNIHSHDINISMLFRHLHNKKTKTIWTFHDCWAFTGYCMHFDYIGCEKWKTQCQDCPQYKKYSYILDRSKFLFNTKKQITNGLNLTIVTPSEWLAQKAKDSFLNAKRITVINNGIDLNIFHFRESDFIERNQLKGKKIVLGVAFDWGEKKGLDVFVRLAKTLPAEYKIVLVGIEEHLKDMLLDLGIMVIEKTNNQKELAEIYSSANVFVNATREDTYPTVNLEAIACGTPVVSFNTGGCSETIPEGGGVIVEKNNIEELEKAIISVANKDKKDFACKDNAKDFDLNIRLSKYIDLYKQLDNSV